MRICNPCAVYLNGHTDCKSARAWNDVYSCKWFCKNTKKTVTFSNKLRQTIKRIIILSCQGWIVGCHSEWSEAESKNPKLRQGSDLVLFMFAGSTCVIWRIVCSTGRTCEDSWDKVGNLSQRGITNPRSAAPRFLTRGKWLGVFNAIVYVRNVITYPPR